MRGDLFDPDSFRDPARGQPENIFVIPITLSCLAEETLGDSVTVFEEELIESSKLLESLILAQDERWRRA